jgi:hypothetical protein
MDESPGSGAPSGESHIPEIDWVPLGRITVYHVTETELDGLGRGSPDSVFLTFGVFALTAGLSFLASLLAMDAPTTSVLAVFVVLTAVGILAGLVLLALWWVFRRGNKTLIETIKARRLPHGDQIEPSPLPPAAASEPEG